MGPSRTAAVRALPLWLAAAIAASAQPYQPGPQVFTFFSEIDDTDQPYAIYLPKTLEPGKKYPLVISLHGASSNHRLNLKRVFGRGNRFGESDAEATRVFGVFPDVDYIVASPYARGTIGYQGIGEKDVLDVMADVKRRFPVDEDRVFLTGLSMGGGGAMWLGLTRPDLWAAVAAVCPSLPLDVEGLEGNALNLPLKLFQGAADPVVPVEDTRRLRQRLRDQGAAVEYVEYPGIRHNSWDYAYKDAAIFRWFDARRRDRFPAQVRFTARAYAHRSAYWVRFDRLTPGSPAAIDAAFTGPNTVQATTSGTSGFTLDLAGHPRFQPGQPLLLTVDGTVFKTKGPVVSVRREGGAWKQGLAASEGKRAGLDGPLPAAFSGRQVYVYGTLQAGDETEIDRRRAEAFRQADWSTSRAPVLLRPRVIADREWKETDFQGAAVILLGTKETNQLLARWADRLPLALNAGAADYGLLFVYPVDGRYVAVQSGLDFTSRADQVKLEARAYLPVRWRILSVQGDFLLFKRGLDNIVAAGRFDNQWRIPEEAARKLRESGAVTLR